MRKEEKETQDKNNRKKEPSEAQSDPQDSYLPQDSLKAFADKSKDSSHNGSGKRNDYGSYVQNLREQTFRFWKDNPYISAQKLCRELKISHKKHGQTIRNYLSQFRRNYNFGLALKAQELPHKRTFVWEKIVRSEAVDLVALQCRWVKVSNRNGMLSFRDSRGSVHWYRDGLVRMYLKGSAPFARAKELFCRAFSWMSNEEHEKFVNVKLEEKERHWLFDVGCPLPRFDIRQFERTHGLRIYTDGSHPTSLEVAETEPLYLHGIKEILDQLGLEIEAHLDLITRWSQEAEAARAVRENYEGRIKKLETIFEQFAKFLQDQSQPRQPKQSDRGMVV